MGGGCLGCPSPTDATHTPGTAPRVCPPLPQEECEPLHPPMVPEALKYQSWLITSRETALCLHAEPTGHGRLRTRPVLLWTSARRHPRPRGANVASSSLSRLGAPSLALRGPHPSAPRTAPRRLGWMGKARAGRRPTKLAGGPPRLPIFLRREAAGEGSWGEAPRGPPPALTPWLGDVGEGAAGV